MSNFFKWLNINAVNKERFHKIIAGYLDGVLLDIGCGNKQEIFKSRVRRYVGLEYPPARKINDRLTAATDADVYADAVHLPFKPGAFDSVVALSVFEHLVYPKAAADEAWRVLKKGGVFAVTAPFIERMHAEPFDFFRFTIHGIRRILEDAGFTIINITDSGGMWNVIGARLSGYLYSDLLGLGYGPDDLKTRPKWYLAPLVLPFIVLISISSRILDKIHCVKKDSLGYCVICRKQEGSNEQT